MPSKPIFPIGATLKRIKDDNIRWKVLGFNHSTDHYTLVELTASSNHAFRCTRTSIERQLIQDSNIRRP